MVGAGSADLPDSIRRARHSRQTRDDLMSAARASRGVGKIRKVGFDAEAACPKRVMKEVGMTFRRRWWE